MGGGSYEKVEASQEAFSTIEEQADMEIPEPSVVVPWVLNEIVTSTDRDYYKGEGQFELHATRLLSCWKAYGDQFPSAFALEVCLFMQKEEGFQQMHDTVRLVACFLLQMFISRREALHIKIDSQELWPSFLHCLGQRLQAACQEPPLEATLMLVRVREVLDKMKSLTYDCAYMNLLGHDSKNRGDQHGKNIEELMAGIKTLLLETAEVEQEVKREAAKASAKRAPWEKGGRAEQAGNDTLA